MGLSSAMTTALTGLRAAEAQIDVAGNNLANTQTVGFKASDVTFATQFLRTVGVGAAPSDGSGGTNPRQMGLGVQIAEVSPDFSQGTLEISSSASDLAIQGEGFFMVAGAQGETLYTRNGVFKTNSENEIVASTGHRLMGYGVNEDYELQTTSLVPLTIPLGATSAQATENVYLEGNLTPTGDLATTAEVAQSAVLGDAINPRPEVKDPTNPVYATVAATPETSSTTFASGAGASSFVAGDQYEYVFAYVDDSGQESNRSQIPVSATISANGDDITLSTLPSSPLSAMGGKEYDQLNVYRRKLGVPTTDPEADFRLIGNALEGAASFVDSSIAPTTALDETELNGLYSYLVTFSGLATAETRPSELLGPLSLTDGRVHLDNLPTLPAGYDSIHIYRNLASDPDNYYLVTTVGPGVDYTDSRTDAEISDLNIVSNRQLDMDGPRISNSTLLTNIVRRAGLEFEQMFEIGELTYTGRKGGNTLLGKSFDITASTTVGEFLQFISESSGIQTTTDDPDIPTSENGIIGESGVLTPGGVVTSHGQLRFVSNNGIGNALEFTTSAFQIEKADGTTVAPTLGFTSIQEAVGESTLSDFVVYESRGIPVNVRITTALESQTDGTTTYRWFADAGEQDDGDSIAVGTGLLVFDGEGNLSDSSGTTITIQRNDLPTANPLTVNLDFSGMAGFATDTGMLNAASQDGSAVGSLTSFNVGEGGEITGIFSNGVARTLGQVQLARFANPGGLIQLGQNMFGIGFNSGLPVEGSPNNQGLGSIVAGALELSNTDTGQSLIDLMMASNQYRSNSRTISTAQQVMDDLLNMRR